MNLRFVTSHSLFHLLYPHICVGCGSDTLSTDNFICVECFTELPVTNFAFFHNNPVEKIFWGRVSITHGMSQFYFAKKSIMQNLIHELKYKGNKKLGFYLGQLMGQSIALSPRFHDVSALVPLPLFVAKEKLRGYNQAKVLCDGIADKTQFPVIDRNVIRIVHTETQTNKKRLQRWENVAKTFVVANPQELAGRHVLLVDDVITTGATLEACARALLNVPGTRVSIATLAMASD